MIPVDKFMKKGISLPAHNKIIKLNTFSGSDYLQFLGMCLKSKNIQIDSITMVNDRNQDVLVNASIPTNQNKFGEFKLLHFTYKFNDISASCIHSDFTQPDSFSPFWCAFCLFKLGQEYFTIWKEDHNYGYNKQLTHIEDDIKYCLMGKTTKEQDQKSYDNPSTTFQNYYNKIDRKLAILEGKKAEILNKKSKDELNLIKWSNDIATRFNEETKTVSLEFENTTTPSLVK